MIDDKHTNRFVLVCLCNDKLKETEENIVKYYNELLNRDRICDIVILGLNLSEPRKFHTVKVLGDYLYT